MLREMAGQKKEENHYENVVQQLAISQPLLMDGFCFEEGKGGGPGSNREMSLDSFLINEFLVHKRN